MPAAPASIPRLRDRLRLASPQLFAILRERIVSLDLTPGTILSRTELQAEFSLSSTPIRDALLRLESEGLVDIFPQSATVVSRIDLTEARQAQFLRRSVELEVVRGLAGRPDTALIARLDALIADQRHYAGRGDLAGFVTADEAFHRTLCDAAGVSGLWNLIRSRSAQIDRLRRLHLPVEGKATQILGDHSAIVRAIEAGDPASAEVALRDHLSKSLAFSTEMRQRNPDYFRD